MKNLVATYGINSDGQGISRLTDALSDDYKVNLYHHPKRNVLSAYRRHVIARDAIGMMRLVNRLDRPDAVAHSYGALVTLVSMWFGAKYRNVYFFGAAASSDHFPIHLLSDVGAFENLFNFFNVKDRALKAGALLPCHDFGHLGYSGWRGAHRANIINEDFFMTKGLLRHSGYFDEENIIKIKSFMEKHIAN